MSHLIKIGAGGKHLASRAKNWVAVLDERTHLILFTDVQEECERRRGERAAIRRREISRLEAAAEFGVMDLS